MALSYTKTATTISILVDFRSVVVPSSHPNFAKLVAMAQNPNTTEADIKPFLDIPAAVVAFTGGDITVHNGGLFYRGAPVKTNLATVILGFVKSGDMAAAEPFKRFLANCRNNPDLALVDTIYDWCVKGNLPITPDGELLAWKLVRGDYMSKHTGRRGRLDHSIGKTVTEPREECDPNRNQTCSTGIHFASVEYIEKGSYGSISGGDRIVAVVINPADITAIPTDYNLSKGRCCKLRVVGEIKSQSQLGSFYGSAKVYSGWEAPKPKVELPIRAGDRVRLRDGRTGYVTTDGSATVGGLNGRTSQFYLEHGSAWRDQRKPAADDVVETISRGPAVPRAKRNAASFAVGQVWANRIGGERTITSIDGKGEYSVIAGGDVFTKGGRFNSETSVSQFDLVRLVKDVA